MSLNALKTSIDGDRIDALLYFVISAFERAFPGRGLSYYVIGSYAEGMAVALSDLDCLVVFKHEFENQPEEARAHRIGRQCA